MRWTSMRMGSPTSRRLPSNFGHPDHKQPKITQSQNRTYNKTMSRDETEATKG